MKIVSIFVKIFSFMDTMVISIQEIRELRDQLKRCSKTWVKKVAKKMSTPANPVDAGQVYNIVHDMIRDNDRRIKFKKAAEKVLESYKIPA